MTAEWSFASSRQDYILHNLVSIPLTNPKSSVVTLEPQGECLLLCFGGQETVDVFRFPIVFSRVTVVALEMRKKMMEGFRGCKREIRKLKEEMERKEKAWKEERKKWAMEKQELDDKVISIEKVMVRQEREKRKNNIVIKGPVKMDQPIMEAAKQIIKEKIGVNVEVK
ncbi:hypothetical protein FQR65_LT14299 [Abscondita terminalis]|nr:hypothetical protein FQR65_LT14299 [Abscondita terminalis]